MRASLLAGVLVLAACDPGDDLGSKKELLCDCVENPHSCCCTTPIVLDLEGDGVKLTSWQDGVGFALRPQVGVERRAWTQAGADDAWLFRDHTGDGVATDGLELFGDMTEQERPAPGESRNGFRALAEYDDGDGVVNANDPAFKELRLWTDANHDGVSTLDEVSDLATHGIVGLSVVYDEPRWPGPHGNLFRYSAKVETTSTSLVAPVAWDVSLTSPTGAERVAARIAAPVPASNEPPPAPEASAAPATTLDECTLSFLKGRPDYFDGQPTGTVQASAMWRILAGTYGASCPNASTTSLRIWQFHLGGWRNTLESSYPGAPDFWTRMPKVCRFRYESTWKGSAMFTFPAPWATMSRPWKDGPEERLTCSNFDTPNDPPPTCEETP